MALRATQCAALAGCMVGAAWAQKAEPLRIEFKRGSYGATVQNQLNGDEQMEYILAAGKGQKLTLALNATPLGSLDVTLRDQDTNVLPLTKTGPARWTATLTKSSDYLIWVARMKTGAARSRFALTVTIR